MFFGEQIWHDALQLLEFFLYRETIANLVSPYKCEILNQHIKLDQIVIVFVNLAI